MWPHLVSWSLLQPSLWSSVQQSLVVLEKPEEEEGGRLARSDPQWTDAHRQYLAIVVLSGDIVELVRGVHLTAKSVTLVYSCALPTCP